MVNRVIRDDPSKSDMNNREALTFKLLFKSLCDFDLWPLYLIGLTNHIPFATPSTYLTLSLKGMGFTTFQTNLLVIPSQLLHSESPIYLEDNDMLTIEVMNMLILTYLSQAINQAAMVAMISQFWALPFLVWLRVVDTTTVSKWTTWLVMTIFLGSPYGETCSSSRFVQELISVAHPIQVGWVSRNANTVRSRTVGAAMYNMCVQG